MKWSHWLPVFALLFAAGWGSARLERSRDAASNAPSAERAKEKATARAGKAWVPAIRERTTGDFAAFAKSVPRDELPAAIEAWLKSFGLTTLTQADREKLDALLEELVSADFEKGWVWAQGLKNPLMREWAMTAFAAELAEKDPDRAFDGLMAIGEFRELISDQRLIDVIDRRARAAQAKGVDALEAFWRGIPGSKETRSVCLINVPLAGNEENARIADLVRKLKEEGRSEDTHRPIEPDGIMREWAKKDPEGAAAYVMDRGLNGVNMTDEMQALIFEHSRNDGREGGAKWAAEFLGSLPEGKFGAFAVDSNLLAGSSFNLVEVADLMGSRDRADQALLSSMQAAAGSSKEIQIGSLLGKMTPERCLGLLSELRGVSDFSDIHDALEKQGVDEKVIEDLGKLVTRPKP